MGGGRADETPIESYLGLYTDSYIGMHGASCLQIT